MQNEMENTDIKTYIMEHLVKANKGFEQELNFIDSHVVLLKLIKEQIDLILKIDDKYPRNELEKLKLERLIKLDENWKQNVAIKLYFKLEKPHELRFILEKRSLWIFLLDSSNIHRLCQWLGSSLTDKEFFIELNNEFENTLNELFTVWDIDYDMLQMIECYPKLHLCDTLLNFFAKHNYFVTEEQQNVLKYTRRVALSQMFDQNQSNLISEPIVKQLIVKCLEDTNFYTIFELLNNFPEIKSYSFVQDLNEQSSELKLLTTKYDNTSIREASKQISKYLSSQHDEKNHKNVFIQMFENSENFLNILSQFQHFKNFLKNYENNYVFTEQSEHEIMKSLLLKRFNLNLDDVINAIDLSKDKFLNTIPKSYNKLSLTQNLQQCRSSHALFNNFIEQLKTYSKITKENLQFVTHSAIDVALQNFSNNEIVCHCVSIIEMVGYDTSNLRSIITVSKMYQEVPENIFIKDLNFELDISISEHFSVVEFKRLFAIIKFCDIYSYQYPSYYLKLFAEKNQWRQFILFSQIFHYPLKTVMKITKNSFANSTMAKNILCAIGNTVSSSKSIKSKRFEVMKKTSSSSIETTKSFHEESDLFYILLTSPSWYKLNNKSNQYKWPVLAVLSASLYRTNHLECWKYWLCNTVRYMERLDYIENSEFEFNLIQHCIQIGFLKSLRESFYIFFSVST